VTEAVRSAILATAWLLVLQTGFHYNRTEIPVAADTETFVSIRVNPSP